MRSRNDVLERVRGRGPSSRPGSAEHRACPQSPRRRDRSRAPSARLRRPLRPVKAPRTPEGSRSESVSKRRRPRRSSDPAVLGDRVSDRDCLCVGATPRSKVGSSSGPPRLRHRAGQGRHSRRVLHPRRRPPSRVPRPEVRPMPHARHRLPAARSPDWPSDTPKRDALPSSADVSARVPHNRPAREFRSSERGLCALRRFLHRRRIGSPPRAPGLPRAVPVSTS